MTTMGGGRSRLETVTAFAHGLVVMRSFTREHRRQTITGVSERTGFSRAAVRRLLRTLCEEGLARTDGKYFQLTPAILAFGQAFLAGMTELEVVREVLLDFTRQTGGSASAAMLVGVEVIYVTRLPSPSGNLGLAFGPGMRRPAHATAIGQVLLAGLHPRELDRYLQTAPLEKCGPNTITNKKALRQRLDQVRGQGFAAIAGEMAPGHSSIAVSVAPLGDPAATGVTRLGIASGGYSEGMDADRMMQTLLPALHEAATHIAMLAAST